MTRSRASAKQAGTRFESAIVDYPASRGWRHAERRAKTGALDKGDITGIPGVECDRAAQARGWCKMHWRRWRKTGDPNSVQIRGSWNKKAGPCEVAGCDRTAHARGLCSKHYTRWAKHGDVEKLAPTGRPLKGDHLSFAGVHKRLMRLWGPASSRQCVDCEGRAAEWSYDGLDPKQLTGESNGFVLAYSLDLSHYQPRCTSCHRKFDGAGDRPRDALGRFTSERAA